MKKPAIFGSVDEIVEHIREIKARQAEYPKERPNFGILQVHDPHEITIGQRCCVVSLRNDEEKIPPSRMDIIVDSIDWVHRRITFRRIESDGNPLALAISAPFAGFSLEPYQEYNTWQPNNYLEHVSLQ